MSKKLLKTLKIRFLLFYTLLCTSSIAIAVIIGTNFYKNILGFSLIPLLIVVDLYSIYKLTKIMDLND